ncbi:hypothetical protein DPMN_068252 [Dreissena polymorpha]|uniref:Uncharacterized protein n=1 Tax=Dreissena polymorpha TaxID=45954 RepID=A0A9D3YXA3_DREPO|nr:hypothetical protein DPMN_068252 [Dreissena polymorpha]
MFGRHPKLAIDALLGLSSETDENVSKHEYVRKLKERLYCAYKKAEEFAKNANSGDKRRYDARAKAT